MKRINYIQGLIAVLLAAGMAGCQLYDTTETKQSDAGAVLTSITLDNTSMYLYGSTGASSQTITASYAPSYAKDTAITWTSSNESVATIAVTGATCTVTLKGNGTSIITAANAAGNVQSTCTVTGVLETVPPFVVSDLTKTGEYGNNIRFSWTNPSKNADDLSSILIRTYSCADASSASDSNWVSDTTVETTAKGSSMSKAVTGLSAETNYTFLFYAVDVNGNKSDAVASAGTTTAADTAVAAPTNVAVSASTQQNAATDVAATASSDFTGTVTVAWTDPLKGIAAITWTASTDSDIDYYRLSASSSTEGVAVPDSVSVVSTLTTGTLSGLSANTAYVFTVTAVDYNGNEAGASSDSYTTGGDFDHVAVTCTDGTTPITKNVAAGKKTYRFSGLTAGKSYSFYINTMDAAGTSQGTSATVAAIPVIVLWQIYNTYSSSTAQMVPNITSSNSYKNVVTPITVTSYKYTYWKVVPSLAYDPDASTTAATYDTDDATAFSLEATDSTGTSTGLYLCIDSKQTYSNDPIGWGYPYSSHSNHVWALSTDTLASDGLNAGYASFTAAASSYTGTTYSGKSAWYLFKCVPDGSTTYYLYDTYLNISGETSADATSGDYVFAYAKTTIN